jgi:hypothetical protein
MHTPAPTADELEQHPTIQAALEAAWQDSLPDDPAARHEEGGWIYQNLATGEITARRASPGRQAALDLTGPPVLDGYVVVGKFHTHPNPTAEGWDPGPSRADRRVDEQHGVPDLIRADNGVYHSGPARRRGGLGGNPGYPA